eukprot:4486132-Lingulodinium_polyedra.AAC.1
MPPCPWPGRARTSPVAGGHAVRRAARSTPQRAPRRAPARRRCPGPCRCLGRRLCCPLATAIQAAPDLPQVLG